MSLLNEAQRLYDQKPWAAHIYVTDNCNLDCSYCNEFDNTVDHPATEDVKKWMRKLRELGVKRLGYLGGEPLLHPDFVELVRYGKELGFTKLSMSTNGFLLTKKLLRELEEAGLDQMQFSVDRMTPNGTTKKSLKTVRHKLEWFKDSTIGFNVNSVLCNDTADQVGELIDTCLEEDVGVHARVIHDDLINDRKLRLYPSIEPLKKLLDYQIDLKGQGEQIHTSWNLLDFQHDILRQKQPEWKCIAGYKYFFVSSEGKFWPCSQVRTDVDIMDVTWDYLKSWDEPKECQKDCGVWCIVDMSLAVNDPVSYVKREAKGRAQSKLVQLRRKGERLKQTATPA
jgi:MoaA/NifB/PqqE/SkfB family radical SAM enzyme